MSRFIVLLPLLLAACGNLPRPFQHEGNDAPLSSPRSMQPVMVAEMPERPGLAKALVEALDREDIAASTADGGDNFLKLQGKVEGGKMHWRLVNAKGEQIGEFSEANDANLAARTANSIGHLLRGDDLGGADLAARPKVAVDKVTVTGSLDAELLKRALIQALERQGIAVVQDGAMLRVSGNLTITQGLAGHDLVEVTWVVSDDQGKEVGKVNQGSPVMRDDLLSKAIDMTHQIAEGGAEGVKQLVKLKN
jgi:hypothetical protein